MTTRSETPSREQQRVLQETLTRVAASPGGLCVFDLDSTLLDNRPRQARILRELGAARNIPQLTHARADHWTSWSITTAMIAAGVPQLEAIRVASDARSFWRDRFFTSEYCVEDVAIPGAAAFVKSVLATGARVAYVTGRHLAMGDGTQDSLHALGFPLPDGDRCSLSLKPTVEMSDDEWKIHAAEELREQGKVVAVFDNEPAHVNIYVAAFPSALVVHLATDHSGRPIAVAPGVPAIANFTFTPRT